MNILILGTPVFCPELRVLGHTVITAGTSFDRDLFFELRDFSFSNILKGLPPDFHPDVCLYIEELDKRNLPLGLEDCPYPFIFYSIDTHLNNFWLEEFANFCTGILTTQKDYVPLLKKRGATAHWLPWSYEPDLYLNLGLERDMDIVFVGTVDEHRERRGNMLEQLEKRYSVARFCPTPAKRYSPAEISELFSRARIIVNESICGEINFRIFEATATGAMLLTEHIENGLDELFAIGAEIITFTPLDLISKAACFLRNEDARGAIASAGQKAAESRHTRMQRAGELASLLETLEQNARTAKLLPPGRAYYLMLRRGLMNYDPYWREAGRLLDLECQRDSEHGECVLNLAEYVSAGNNRHLAEKYYATAWLKGCRSFRLATQWGLLLLELGRTDDAKKVLTTILTMNISEVQQDCLSYALAAEIPSVQLFYGLGIIAETTSDRFQAGFYVESRLNHLPLTGADFLKMGLALAPDNVKICRALADIYQKKRQSQSALDYFLRAVENSCEPGIEEMFMIVQTLTDLFCYHEALLWANNVLQIQPDNEPCRYIIDRLQSVSG